MSWYLDTFRRALDFGTRSRRRELWPFLLVNTVIAVLALGLDTALGTGGFSSVSGPGTYAFLVQPGIVSSVFGLIVLLPSLAVEARRLHDTGRSAWWLLILLVPLVGVVVLIVFWSLDGERGTNRFGSNPKAAEPSMA